jgi:hypothetical protein
MITFVIDSTSEKQVRLLVRKLVIEERLEYRVLNEYDEDITTDFHRLTDLAVRKYVKDSTLSW